MKKYREIFNAENLYGQTIICLFESLGIFTHVEREGKTQAERKLYPKIYVLVEDWEKAWEAIESEGFEKYCVKNGEIKKL